MTYVKPMMLTYTADMLAELQAACASCACVNHCTCLTVCDGFNR